MDKIGKIVKMPDGDYAYQDPDGKIIIKGYDSLEIIGDCCLRGVKNYDFAGDKYEHWLALNGEKLLVYSLNDRQDRSQEITDLIQRLKNPVVITDANELMEEDVELRLQNLCREIGELRKELSELKGLLEK